MDWYDVIVATILGALGGFGLSCLFIRHLVLTFVADVEAHVEALSKAEESDLTPENTVSPDSKSPSME